MIGWIGSLIGGIFGFAGNVASGIFNVKSEQVNLVGKTIDSIASANLSASEREKAIAAVITAEASSDRWLTAVWRPLVMLLFTGMIVAYFFGYTTPNLLESMPDGSIIAELFDIVKIGLMGYMPLRTLEKIATQINLTQVVKKILEK